MTKVTLDTDNLPKRQSVLFETVKGAAIGAVLGAGLAIGTWNIAKLINPKAYVSIFGKRTLVEQSFSSAAQYGFLLGMIIYAGTIVNNDWRDRIDSEAAKQTWLEKTKVSGLSHSDLAV